VAGGPIGLAVAAVSLLVFMGYLLHTRDEEVAFTSRAESAAKLVNELYAQDEKLTAAFEPQQEPPPTSHTSGLHQ
jgi:hypothetical protein